MLYKKKINGSYSLKIRLKNALKEISPVVIKNCSNTCVLQTQKGRANKHHGNRFSQLMNEKENVAEDKHL